MGGCSDRSVCSAASRCLFEWSVQHQHVLTHPPPLTHLRLPAAHPTSQGDPRQHATWLASRPRRFEQNAVRALLSALRATAGSPTKPGFRLHIVHLSGQARDILGCLLAGYLGLLWWGRVACMHQIAGHPVCTQYMLPSLSAHCGNCSHPKLVQTPICCPSWLPPKLRACRSRLRPAHTTSTLRQRRCLLATPGEQGGAAGRAGVWGGARADRGRSGAGFIRLL